jgi:hypothetical protein
MYFLTIQPKKAPDRHPDGTEPLKKIAFFLPGLLKWRVVRMENGTGPEQMTRETIL